MPYPVQNLLAGRGAPIAVREDDPLPEAALMTDTEERSLGMVTYHSVVNMISKFRQLSW